MRPIDMRRRCYRCSDYRSIQYADGSRGMGCMAASTNGYPVDIRNMESCPTEHSRERCRDIDRQELLTFLGQVYARSSARPEFFSLSAMLNKAGESVKRKRTFVSAAILEMGILEVVSTSGRKHQYKWNMDKWGAPSLAMAEMINEKTHLIAFGMVDKRRVKHTDMHDLAPFAIDRGATHCYACRLKDISNCREVLSQIGIDCKHYDINTIRLDETRLG